MNVESTQNSRALPPQDIKEMMADVRRRLQVQTTAAREAARKQEEEGARVGATTSASAGSSASSAAAQKQSQHRTGAVLPGQSLRESESQLHRVFQLFDPRNSKLVPLGEVVLLLRAVAIDVDDTILREVMANTFPADVCAGIVGRSAIDFEQFLLLVRQATATAGSKHEARRVFEMVLPAGASAVTFDAFKQALAKADARITDAELSEIFRYCSLSGNKEGLVLSDWEQVADFIAEVGV